MINISERQRNYFEQITEYTFSETGKSDFMSLNLVKGEKQVISYDMLNGCFTLRQNIKECIFLNFVSEYNPDEILDNLLNRFINPNPEFEFPMSVNVTEPLFTKHQIYEINNAECFKVKSEKLAKTYFSPRQMHLLNFGMFNKLDIDEYAKPEYSYEKMDIIIKAQMKYLDITKLLNPELTLKQMKDQVFHQLYFN